jgi:hypothetical protein
MTNCLLNILSNNILDSNLGLFIDCIEIYKVKSSFIV